MKRFATLVFAACIGLAAHAADFPSRPVRIIVPSTPAGGLDVLARLLAPRLTEKWGQQIVIENRAGAGGIIGTEIAAKATPDGHTLLLVAAGYSANPFLYKSLPYDTPKDFAPITILGFAPNVLVVHPSVGVSSVRELIALAKHKPGTLTYASSGVGTSGHLAMALLERSAGVKMIHVPYKGAGAATAAVVAGETHMLFSATAAVMPHVKSGRIRALAVTSGRRWPSMADVPTMAEAALPGYAVDGWYAMLAPGKTPKAIVNRIYDDVVGILKMPEVASKIQAAGFEVSGIPSAEFSKYIDSELRKWGAVIKEAGIRAE
ncbi:MAG TPA: tripartite tricarboxylate transporter substrate binding protein [Burkholderiales bacterium]|nr:tripartite tricarboxylate transporter substrate binding protein [Burkholderiales bacterium]